MGFGLKAVILIYSSMFDVYNLLDVEPVRRRKPISSGTVMEINTLIFTGTRRYFNRTFASALRGVGDGQLNRIGFYSNAVKNHLQEELSEITGAFPVARIIICFFCNSGAEANEMLETVFFVTGRSKILAMHAAFHGRTSGAATYHG